MNNDYHQNSDRQENDKTELDEEGIIISEINPFYIDYKGSALSFRKNRDLYRDFKKCYLLCLEDNFGDEIEKLELFFTERMPTTRELEEISPFIHLMPCQMNSLKIFGFRKRISLIKKSFLNPFNRGLDLEESNLVIVIPEVRKYYIQHLLLNQEVKKMVDQFLNLKSFYSYLNMEISHRYFYLLEIEDKHYWECPENCKVTTKIFLYNSKKSNRDLLVRKPGDFYASLEKFEEVDTENTGENPKIYSRDCHSISPPIPVEYLENVFTGSELSTEEKYYLFANLLLSRHYAHAVLTNKKIMLEAQPLFHNHPSAFRYILSYAWAYLLLEEKDKKIVMDNDNFVFDLESARLLPFFPLNPDKFRQHPYLLLNYNDKEFEFKKNLNGVHVINNSTYPAIPDIDTFRKRLNIFILGISDINILEGVDWSHMVITGGIMSAIMTNKNPKVSTKVLGVNGVDTLSDEDYHNFFMKNYKDSDIDCACNFEAEEDYIRHVVETKKIIYQNIRKIIPEYQLSNIQVKNIKTMRFVIDAEILKLQCELGLIPFSYEQICAPDHPGEITKYFYEKYLEEKRKLNEINSRILGEKIREEIYEYSLNVVPLEEYTYIISPEPIYVKYPNKDNVNCFIDTMYNDKIFIRVSESNRYKVGCEFLYHEFEFFNFRRKVKDFFACIADFHLPCVRSYYNGTTCRLIPSAITAYHTMTNINIRYSRTLTSNHTILFKYRSRGYGTILANKHIKDHLEFCKGDDKYTSFFRKKGEVLNLQDIVGFLPNEPHNTGEIPTPNSEYKSNMSEEFLDECATNGRGDVIPLKKWLLWPLYHAKDNVGSN